MSYGFFGFEHLCFRRIMNFFWFCFILICISIVIAYAFKTVSGSLLAVKCLLQENVKSLVILTINRITRLTAMFGFKCYSVSSGTSIAGFLFFFMRISKNSTIKEKVIEKYKYPLGIVPTSLPNTMR